jgi:hypothetical protein
MKKDSKLPDPIKSEELQTKLVLIHNISSDYPECYGHHQGNWDCLYCDLSNLCTQTSLRE